MADLTRDEIWKLADWDEEFQRLESKRRALLVKIQELQESSDLAKQDTWILDFVRTQVDRDEGFSDVWEYLRAHYGEEMNKLRELKLDQNGERRLKSSYKKSPLEHGRQGNLARLVKVRYFSWSLFCS